MNNVGCKLALREPQGRESIRTVEPRLSLALEMGKRIGLIDFSDEVRPAFYLNEEAARIVTDALIKAKESSLKEYTETELKAAAVEQFNTNMVRIKSLFAQSRN